MNSDGSNGGNGKVLRMVPNPGGGRLVLPAHVAAQQQRAFTQVLLAWCPVAGAYAVAEGTIGQTRQIQSSPNQPPTNTMWVVCPHCMTGEAEPVFHMANAVLVDAAEWKEAHKPGEEV